MKKMTEIEAWKLLAKEPERVGQGICTAISLMESDGEISLATWEQMYRFMNKYAEENNLYLEGAWWPFTAEGDKSRRRFCRARARELEKKRNS